MDVNIKSFDADAKVKTNGIEFEVRRPNEKGHVGDCFLTKTGLTWCQGKTTKPNGTKLSWENLATILSSDEARKAAVKAAKVASKP